MLELYLLFYKLLNEEVPHFGYPYGYNNSGLSSTYAHLIDNEPEFIYKVDNSVNLKLHRVHKSKGILMLI